MTIIYEAVKLRYARVYLPETTDYEGKPRKFPEYYALAYEEDNPGRSELPYRTNYRLMNNPYCGFRSTQPPRVTMRNASDYEALIALHRLFGVRNIPLDRMLQGAICDIVLTEYPKGDETVLHLSELIFDGLSTFNINGEKLS